MNHSANTKKIVHVPAKNTVGERKSAKMQIPKPLTHVSTGTFMYKLFDKKYLRARIIHYDTQKGYYTVRYNDNDEK